jgi:hypothetical protein
MTFRDKALKLINELRVARSTDQDNAYYGELGLKFEKFFASVYKHSPENCTDIEMIAIMDAKTPWEEEYISEMFEEWQCKPQ